MTEDPGAVTRRAYNATADRYRTRWHHTDPLTDTKDRFAAQLAPSARLLDVGCGTGRDLEWFAARGFEVIGVDVSLAMLRLCATDALINGDMRLLPFRDACIDGWWASASLLHVNRPDLRIALRELHRVTRADGVGFVSVKHGHGQAYERVDDGPHRRFFCYWQDPALDEMLGGTGWSIKERWTSADVLGRAPWLCRIITRRPEFGRD